MSQNEVLADSSSRKRAGSRLRRALAVVLSLIQPGAGHFLIGSFRRGILWAAALTGGPLLLLLAAPTNVVMVMAAMVIALVGRLACAADAVRAVVGRPHWGMVVLGGGTLLCVSLLLDASKDYYRANYVQAFTIPSGSMMDTLLVGDYILVDKSVYRIEPPRRGDIVVFSAPLDERRAFIHRIVGTPGETLQARGQQVLINGSALEEPYVRRNPPSLRHSGSSSCNYAYACEPLVIPDDSYFGMGDNRGNSQDSRYWGFVKREKIKGKAREIYWSWHSDRHWLRWQRLGHRIS